MTATWNTDLIECVGTTLGGKMQAIGAHILWPLAVSMHRSQPAGRDLECYSEDPFLTGRMAIAYIDGLQGQGVGAGIKHSVCNDSKFEQRTLSSQVSERALREIYLSVSFPNGHPPG